MKSMSVRRTIPLAALALLVAAVASPARADLERVGPNSNDPRIGGFPAWYQDKTGASLEFCDPLNQAEVDGGWCLLLTGDVLIPESFPTNFFDEHFYFSADASAAPANGGKALLVTALEAAFGTGPAAIGDQVTFARVRLVLNPVPATGNYRFIYPFGEVTLPGVAGDRIFNTVDAGLGLPGGPFDGALRGELGPFLMASNTPGGAELPAIAGPVPGKLYIADPARLGPVTGSTLPNFIDSTGASRNHNIFRIEGPAGSALGGVNPDGSTIDFIETTDFSLMGRFFTDTISGRVTANRATYTTIPTGLQLDVFAKGEASTAGRLPTQPRPAAVMPQLSYYEAACSVDANGVFGAPTGALEVFMQSDRTKYWGQSNPAALPAQVCLKDAAARDATGAIVPAFFQQNVTDDVTVTQASFDPTTGALTVKAISTDTLNAPALTIDDADYPSTLTSGQAVVSPLIAPPTKVRVVSSAGGAGEMNVTAAPIGAPPAGAIVATNDSFTIAEDAGATTLGVLANDTGVAGGTVTLISQPRLGTASVNLDGSITYTPNLNANGADAFTYTVTVGTAVSNTGNVAIAITPVNDPTTAINDGPFPAQAGVATALPNVLDNDLDADGRADLVDAVEVTATTPGATVSGGLGGIVTFQAASPGNYTFTYKAKDRAGNVSNAATVIVKVIGEDTVVAASALFRTDKARWVISGSDSEPNQHLTITYDDGGAAGTVIGFADGDVNGNWLLDVRGVTGALNPTTVIPRPTHIRVTSPLGGSGTVVISIR